MQELIEVQSRRPASLLAEQDRHGVAEELAEQRAGSPPPHLRHLLLGRNGRGDHGPIRLLPLQQRYSHPSVSWVKASRTELGVCTTIALDESRSEAISEVAREVLPMMNMRPLRNALITGAAKRIGRGIALDLARHGWGIAVHYKTSLVEAEGIVAAIRAGGGRAAPLRADLEQEEEVEELVPRAVEALGPLSCLVNNASVFENDGVLNATRKSWDYHLAINLRAPLVLIQGFVRQLPQNTSGNIINIIDERVWNLTPHFLSYTVSKSALWVLTRILAPALAPSIRINAIGPGPALPSVFQTQESFQQLCRTLPLQRGTSPDEIGHAIRFLLDAPAVTGQMLALDGGQHLGWLLPEQNAEMARS